MEDIKQFVFDYIEGRVSSKNFLKELFENSAIMDWLQDIVPDGKTTFEYKFDECFSKVIEKKEVPYRVHDVIQRLWHSPGGGQTGRELDIFGSIARLLKEAFPDANIQVDDTLEKKYRFLLSACPEYLDSNEIEEAGILDDLLEEFPETMPKAKRIKAVRDELKKMFYVEGQKYPRWIQESEWPLSKTGKPTKFLRQKNKGEVSYYYFLDMDTQEEIEVMQAY